METVVCYDADTGREVWNRQIEARLDDPMGGPGPRATPTLASGGLFITGATGTFLRLDPATGEVVWKQDLSNRRRTESSDVGICRFAARHGLGGDRLRRRPQRQRRARL